MNKNNNLRFEEEMHDQLSPPDDPVFFSGEHLWIGGIHITPFECPGCLEGEEIDEDQDCNMCDYLDPDICILSVDPNMLQDIKSLFDVYRERHETLFKEYIEHRENLVNAITNELRKHGRPLHYSILAEMITDRYPTLDVTERRVLKIMFHRPQLFVWVSEGVYRYKGS